jgi:hypothetical protein
MVVRGKSNVHGSHLASVSEPVATKLRADATDRGLLFQAPLLSKAGSVLLVGWAAHSPNRSTNKSTHESNRQNECEAKQRVAPVNGARIFEHLVGDEKHTAEKAKSKTPASKFMSRWALMHDGNRNSITNICARQQLHWVIQSDGRIDE